MYSSPRYCVGKRSKLYGLNFMACMLHGRQAENDLPLLNVIWHDLLHAVMSGSAHGVSGSAEQIAASRLKSILARFKPARRILDPYRNQAVL
mmetsp:Transcript_71329/g.180464  ORF Transcript_71329/g.180464 Transcript_71329/m.180464 type:complete len:92 (-) Transcript_71329:46-321(-)